MRADGGLFYLICVGCVGWLHRLYHQDGIECSLDLHSIQGKCEVNNDLL